MINKNKFKLINSNLKLVRLSLVSLFLSFFIISCATETTEVDPGPNVAMTNMSYPGENPRLVLGGNPIPPFGPPNLLPSGAAAPRSPIVKFEFTTLKSNQLEGLSTNIGIPPAEFQLNPSSGQITVSESYPRPIGPVWFAVKATGIRGYTGSATNYGSYSFDVWVTTFAGNTGGYRDDLATTEAEFSTPRGVVVADNGDIYVADSSNHRIRKITFNGSDWEVTTLAGGERGHADGMGTAAQFSDPRGLAIDGEGNIIVADSGNSRIRKVTPGGVVTTLAGNGEFAYANGVGIAAKFSAPRGVVVADNGDIYVADWANNRIRKMTLRGSDWDVTTLAGGERGYADGMGTAAQFWGPVRIALDADGNLYVTSDANDLIRKITPGGEVTTLAGDISEVGNQARGFADGPGLSAKFNSPTGIAIDGDGNLYVADSANNRIRKLSQDGRDWVVSTLAGSGQSGTKNGPGKSALFSFPEGLAIDHEGNLYVVDNTHDLIRKIAQ